ncbi:MAG: hypothetical protein WBF71_03275 [Microthrixaceae bacterium]
MRSESRQVLESGVVEVNAYLFDEFGKVEFEGSDGWSGRSCRRSPATARRPSRRSFQSFDLDRLYEPDEDRYPADGHGLILRSTSRSALLDRVRHQLRDKLEGLPLKHFDLSANNTAIIEVVSSDFSVRPFDLAPQWEDPSVSYSDRESLVRDSARVLPSPW